MLEELVSSLLYEGYALYPYTPGATKNATPTPFGIVYPPVYAAECAGAFDHARLECVAEPAARRVADGHAPLPGAVRRAPRGVRAAGRARAGAASASGTPSTFAGGRLTVRSSLSEDGAVRSCAAACTTRSTWTRASTAAAALGVLADLHPHPARAVLGAVHLAAQERPRERQHVARAGEQRRTTRSSAPRSSSRTTRRSPRSPTATCSTTPRSRRRSSSTSTRSRDAERAGRVRAGPGRARDARAGDGAHAAGHHRAALRAEGATMASGRGRPRRPSTIPARSAPPSTASRTSAARRSCCARGPTATCSTRCSTGAGRRSSGSTSTTTTACYLAVTVDDDPGQQLMRETGRYLFFFANEVQPA